MKNDDWRAWAAEHDRRLADERPVWTVELVHHDDEQDVELSRRRVFGPATFASCEEYVDVFKDAVRGEGRHEIRETAAA